MSSFIAAFMRDEDSAAAAVRALEALHREGRITLFGVARLARGAEGRLVMLGPPTGPGGITLVRVVEALGAVAAIEAGLAAGGGARSPVACLDDLASLGLDTDFVDLSLRMLAPGVVAVLVEADEHWLAPTGAVLAELGATLVRSQRGGQADGVVAQRILGLEAELQTLEQEGEAAYGAERTALRRRAADVRARLAAAVEAAEVLLARMEEENTARLEALEAQLEQAGADLAARREIEARISVSVAQARAEAAGRADRLRQAASLAQAALGQEGGG